MDNQEETKPLTLVDIWKLFREWAKNKVKQDDNQ